MDSQLYGELNKSWKSTCRILLGEEIGDLIEYETYLSEYYPNIRKRKSHISGKEVNIALDHYCDEANFILFEETKEKQIKPESLNINEIKDIDSVLEAISEKWEYVGNKVLGNSNFVEASDIVINSNYVLNSANVQESSYVFSSFYCHSGSKYVFGSNWLGESGEFVIRGTGCYNVKRIFEGSLITTCSDIYFSHNCLGCHDLLFCFNQRSKNYRIGNLDLPKEQYSDLKKKLMEEVKEELKKSKQFPSIYDFVPNNSPNKDLSLSLEKKNMGGDMSPIEKAFTTTAKLIFKKELLGIQEHEKWLSKYLPRLEEISSPFGYPTFENDYTTLPLYPDKRVVSEAEALELGKRHLKEEDIQTIEKISKSLSDIGYFTGELYSGETINIFKSPVVWHSSNFYKVADGSYCDYCAVDFTLLYDKYMFGCHKIKDSQHCINCYNSINLKRCFEMESCYYCTDSYFCHNSEGLSDAMFCFNVKGKRYAIGNIQLQPDKYKEIKNLLISQMADEIEKNKSLNLNIFNIGCYGR